MHWTDVLFVLVALAILVLGVLALIDYVEVWRAGQADLVPTWQAFMKRPVIIDGKARLPVLRPLREEPERVIRFPQRMVH